MLVILKESGFCGSWTDVRTKVDYLTRKYKQEKTKIGPTGGTPSTSHYYNKIHNILGSFKQHNIEIFMHESTDMSTILQEDVIEFDPDISCSSYTQNETDTTPEPPPKKKKIDVNSEFVMLARERNELQKVIQEEKKVQVNEILKRLDTISSQNANFQNQLLEILREKINP